MILDVVLRMGLDLPSAHLTVEMDIELVLVRHLAESRRMPVIVTNQVRFQGGPGGQETAFTSAGIANFTIFLRLNET